MVAIPTDHVCKAPAVHLIPAQIMSVPTVPAMSPYVYSMFPRPGATATAPGLIFAVGPRFQRDVPAVDIRVRLPYDSAATACLTMRELQRWLALAVATYGGAHRDPGHRATGGVARTGGLRRRGE